MKNKKLFGVINIVDIVVILLIIAMVGVVAVKLLGSKATDVVSAKTTIYAEVEIIGCDPRLQKEVTRQMEDLVGARMVSGNEYLTATIEDVWFEDYYQDVSTREGTLEYAKSPDKQNIVFLIKGEVAEGTATPKIGSQEVRAGRGFIVKTQTFETSGTIRYVNLGEYTK